MHSDVETALSQAQDDSQKLAIMSQYVTRLRSLLVKNKAQLRDLQKSAEAEKKDSESKLAKEKESHTKIMEEKKNERTELMIKLEEKDKHIVQL